MAQAGRVPPHSSDAERSVLGALLLSRDAMVEIADKLIPEMFYESAHQLIMKTANQLMWLLSATLCAGGNS